MSWAGKIQDRDGNWHLVLDEWVHSMATPRMWVIPYHKAEPHVYEAVLVSESGENERWQETVHAVTFSAPETGFIWTAKAIDGNEPGNSCAYSHTWSLDPSVGMYDSNGFYIPPDRYSVEPNDRLEWLSGTVLFAGHSSPMIRDPKTLFVMLPWEQYHDLNQWGTATIHATLDMAEQVAERACGRSGGWSANQIVQLPAPDAWRLKKAFHDLCTASWTPNQSSEEQRSNGEIIKAAQAVIEELT